MIPPTITIAPARIPIIAGVPSPPEEELDELSAADELELAAADDELSDLVELSAADELLSAGAADELSAGAADEDSAGSADEDSAEDDSADELSASAALS